MHLQQQIVGELDLADFTDDCCKVYLYPKIDYSQLEIVNCADDRVIHLQTAQEWLDEHYPVNGTCQRKNESLDI
jgi:hypothetical protein